MMPGILGRWRGGEAVLNHSPSLAPFSAVSGGYQERSAGLPSKKSGLWWWRCVSGVVPLKEEADDEIIEY